MRVLQRDIVVDGYKAVLKTMALPHMVVDVARGDDAHAQLPRQTDEAPVAVGVPLNEVLLDLQEIVALTKEVPVPRSRLTRLGEAPLIQKQRHFAPATAGEGR